MASGKPDTTPQAERKHPDAADNWLVKMYELDSKHPLTFADGDINPPGTLPVRESGPDWFALGRPEMAMPMAEAYDPDQPRDDHGRWSSGGGSGGGTTLAGDVAQPQPWQQDAPWRLVAPTKTESHAAAASYVADHIKTAGGYTPQEKQAVADYISHDGGARINGALRGSTTPDAQTSAEIANLTSAIDKNVTTEDMVVYRGVTAPVEQVLAPGGTYTDRAFLSTSLTESTSAEYSTGHAWGINNPGAPPTMFAEIHVPAGANVLSVGNALGSHDEAEVLFPPGSVFQAASTPDTVTANFGDATYQVQRLVMDYKGVAADA